MLAALLLFNLELRRGQSIEVARTIVACTIVVGQMAYLLNCRFLRQLVARPDGFFAETRPYTFPWAYWPFSS